MRFTVDSNILIYTLDRLDERRHGPAKDLIARAAELDFFMTTQAIGEFLNVVRRKRLGAFDDAILLADRWIGLFEVVDTSSLDLCNAATLAERRRLQFWDSLMWQVSRSAGADVLLSENFQDGLQLGGMKVLNPFAETNRDELESLLAASKD